MMVFTLNYSIIEEKSSLTYWKKIFNRKKWKKVSKGIRWMPRLSEAKKDVISCEKLWGGANDL